MKEEPVSSACAEILNAREHAVIGVSPFNSYFSEEKIAALIAWAQERFRAFHVYVPDGPSRFTLEALGYSEARARKKASRQGRWLLNKIRRGLDAAGLNEDAAEAAILCSKTLDGCKAYRRMLEEVERACETDPEFRKGCLETSRWALNGCTAGAGAVTADMLQRAVRYIEAEMPLFMNSPALVGAASSVFIYHQCPPFLKSLFQTRRGALISKRQGFVKVTAS